METPKNTRTLAPGDVVSNVFLLKEKSLQTTRSGSTYLTLTFSDKFGEIEGKMWDDAAAVEPQLERMTPVLVEGSVTVFREKTQLTVRRVIQLEWSDELYDQLMPVSAVSLLELKRRFNRMADSITDRYLQGLARELLDDPELSKVYFAVPAAKMMHHATLRGLAEHSLSMMELADLVAQHYLKQHPGSISRDLLVMGAMLHDVGKTVEYAYEHGIDITTRGRLVGHMVLGVTILDRLLEKQPGFPSELADQLRHLIVSHHGELEKGSPVVPITLEALLLHHVDYMDSQFAAAVQLVESSTSGAWTDYSSKFGRRFMSPLRGTDSTTAPEGRDETPSTLDIEVPGTSSRSSGAVAAATPPPSFSALPAFDREKRPGQESSSSTEPPAPVTTRVEKAAASEAETPDVPLDPIIEPAPDLPRKHKKPTLF